LVRFGATSADVPAVWALSCPSRRIGAEDDEP
jgi:hypothetical protein